MAKISNRGVKWVLRESQIDTSYRGKMSPNLPNCNNYNNNWHKGLLLRRNNDQYSL